MSHSLARLLIRGPGEQVPADGDIVPTAVDTNRVATTSALSALSALSEMDAEENAGNVPDAEL